MAIIRDLVNSPPVTRFLRVARTTIVRHRFHLAVLIIVLTSDLLLWNFSNPLVGANSAFYVLPARDISNSVQLLNLYDWPGSYVPGAFGLPYSLAYAGVYYPSGESYSIALFATGFLPQLAAGYALYYLAKSFLRSAKTARPDEFALVSVFTFAFNPSIVFGYTFETTASFLLILVALTHLTFYRSRKYALLLGLAAFYCFYQFPAGTYIIGGLYVLALFLVASFSYIDRRGSSRANALTVTATVALLCVGAIAVANLYQLYPFLIVRSLYTTALASSNPTYPFSFAFDQIETLPNALRLVNNWAIYSSYAPPWMVSYVSSPVIGTLLFLWPGGAIASALFLKRPRHIVLYGVMVAGLFLSKANNPPAGNLFAWAVQSFPIFRPYYNGATFGPILVACYSLLFAFTLSHVYRIVRDVEAHAQSTARANHASRRTGPRGRPSSILSLCLVVGVCTTLMVSVYPMTSAGMYDQGNSTTPVASTLPNYYIHAMDFLESAGGSTPVMVFPAVNTFNSNTVNNTTWFNGVTLYPGVISNPSISGTSALNFVSGRGNASAAISDVYSVPNFLPSPTEGIGLPNVLETQLGKLVDESVNQSSTNFAQPGAAIAWSPYYADDSVSYTMQNGTPVMQYSINLTRTSPGGQWLIGSMNGSLDLSSSSALFSFKGSNIDPGNIQVGLFDSRHDGNWYNVGGAAGFSSGGFTTLAFNLSTPSIAGGGWLNDTTTFVVNYNNPVGSNGSGTLWVRSLKVLPTPVGSSSTWSTYRASDTVTLMGNGSAGLLLNYTVDRSRASPTGDWLIGSLSSPLNMTKSVIVMTFQLIGLNANNLELGLFDPTHSGNWYAFDSYPYVMSGDWITEAFETAQPTTSGGGNLGSVSTIVVNFESQTLAPTNGSVLLRSALIMSEPMYESNATPTAGVLAKDLAVLGVRFAYVDTSITSSPTPSHLGNYYNALFSQNSTYFTTVFHQGTVSIYREELYVGLFSAAAGYVIYDDAQSLRLGLYQNASFPNPAFVPKSEAYKLQGISNSATATRVHYRTVSRTSFEVYSNSSEPYVLQFAVTYGSGWIAQSLGDSSDLPHLEVNGYANGWLVPSGNLSIMVYFAPQSVYIIVETSLVSLPFVLAAVWVLLLLNTRRRRIKLSGELG